MQCAPVVVLPFARPENLRQVLDQVRKAAPAIVYIGSDGPRATHPGDAEPVAQVRALVDEAIDWECDVRKIFRPGNVGVQGNAELTLDTVFAEVPNAIVLDDDCVPHPSFFRFCTELLEHFADDERVAHISGCNEESPLELFDGYSYAFTAFGSNWGWATWARAWHRHRAAFPRPHDETTVRVPYGKPPNRYMPLADVRPFVPARADLITPGGRRFFRDVARGQDLSLSEWGQQWRLSNINVGALAITPAVNMIENVGFGEGSDSGMPERDMQRAAETTFPLQHPPALTINPRVQRTLERNIVRAVGRLARTVRSRTPESLRTAARKAGALVVRGSSFS